MAEQPNATRIANNAIARNGSTELLTSLETATTPTARRIQGVWEDMRRMLLSRHPWNCAVKRAVLNADAEAPAYGWERGYRLPADCLRWLPGFEGDRDWFAGEVEGGVLVTNAVAPIRIRYIADVTDVPSWSPGLVYAMTMLLAEWIAIPVTQSTGIAGFMADKADAAIREAKRMDGLETGRTRRSGMTVRSSWLPGRYRPWTGYYG